MKKTSLHIFISFFLITTSCDLNVENPAPDPRENPEYANWLIPRTQVIIRETEENLKPPLLEPDFQLTFEASYLSAEDLVLGVNIDGNLRAYPLHILNYHEVINDLIQQRKIMICYAPLTGTSAAWDRGNLKGFSSSFKSSRYIYNSNHILYDEETASHWLPMQFECVNGALEGFDPALFPVIETTWDTWISMFPGTKVLSESTGYDYNYSMDPYEQYRLSDSIRFYTQPLDPRLPLKEKVHGIIINDRIKIYQNSLFGDSTSIILDNFQGLSVVIIGNNSRKFMISYERQIPSGSELDLYPVNDGPSNVIIQDNEGNQYDLFGLAVEGPDKGRQLKPTRSLFGYWFALAAMYPDPIIYH
jgi:hypothetical protein